MDQGTLDVGKTPGLQGPQNQATLSVGKTLGDIGIKQRRYAWTEIIGRNSVSVARTVRTGVIFSAKTKIVVFDFAILVIDLEIILLEFVGPEILNLNFVGRVVNLECQIAIGKIPFARIFEILGLTLLKV